MGKEGDRGSGSKASEDSEMGRTEMTKDERSLLLFFETCVVDRAGQVPAEKMNGDDHKIAARWKEEGFVDVGRIASSGGKLPIRGLWVTLSEEAWDAAHKERRARAKRMWAARSWLTAEEKRARSSVAPA